MYKVIGVILLVLGSAAGGYWYGSGNVEIIEKEKVITKEGETHVVYKDRIVTVTRTVRTDGTITETTRTEEREGKKDTSSSVTREEKSTERSPVLASYNLGIRYHAPISSQALTENPYDPRRIEVTGGMRLVGPVWGSIGYRLDNTFILGISMEL